MLEGVPEGPVPGAVVVPGVAFGVAVDGVGDAVDGGGVAVEGVPCAGGVCPGVVV